MINYLFTSIGCYRLTYNEFVNILYEADAVKTKLLFDMIFHYDRFVQSTFTIVKQKCKWKMKSSFLKWNEKKKMLAMTWIQFQLYVFDSHVRARLMFTGVLFWNGNQFYQPSSLNSLLFSASDQETKSVYNS